MNPGKISSSPSSSKASDLILKYFHFIPKPKFLLFYVDETTKTQCGFMSMFLHFHVRLLIHPSLIYDCYVSSFNNFCPWGRSYSRGVKAPRGPSFVVVVAAASWRGCVIPADGPECRALEH